MTDAMTETDASRELARAALQLAMYHNRLDTVENGTAAWEDLDIVGRSTYLQEAKRTIGALGLLGWAPMHLRGVLYLNDDRDSFKMLRETLCRAESAITFLRDDRGEIETDEVDLARIGRLVAEIDRQRPLGPDGKHGELHTPSCGCEDR